MQALQPIKLTEISREFSEQSIEKMRKIVRTADSKILWKVIIGLLCLWEIIFSLYLLIAIFTTTADSRLVNILICSVPVIGGPSVAMILAYWQNRKIKFAQVKATPDFRISVQILDLAVRTNKAIERVAPCLQEPLVNNYERYRNRLLSAVYDSLEEYSLVLTRLVKRLVGETIAPISLAELESLEKDFIAEDATAPLIR
jgi:hypothetical protein